ncbi:ATP-grasp domain-containing protein [Jiangella asiatica]|uniref:Alpha-L-glutamate ligase n=1 Tax=Jiangella asiatica TaxID=2530372 RepID=A0A4R5CIW4_9ACTN|nr:alpha-L-glutamate ligase [Jiangella asiatica]TDD99066.1 alpha-L-glutamate ligase [Jiangella asiatica]
MILVVSYPGEDHTDAVVGTLERQGREVTRLDLSDLPARAGLSLDYADGGRAPRHEVTVDGRTVDLAGASVGWWRRIRGHDPDEALVEPGERAFAVSETTQAVGGMLDALPCTWVNPRAADEAAHRKPYQWAVARGVGLRVPPTLVTNEPDRARAFVAGHGVGRTVFKSLLASWDWRETRLVEAADLDRLASVRYAPVIFQEYVPGVDLRVTIVGTEVFAAEIDATRTSYPVDMRMVVGEASMRAVALPPALTDALITLMKRLDLVYGAVDLRRTAAGEYAFLEVNPAGLWLFAEERTGLPITGAVAARLAALDDEGRTR